MVVGIDVFHEQKDTSSTATHCSVLGFCASYNKTCTKYWTTYRQMETYSSELCIQLSDCMHQAIAHFAEVNGGPPARVVVYRNAVSESQLVQLAALEVE